MYNQGRGTYIVIYIVCLSRPWVVVVVGTTTIVVVVVVIVVEYLWNSAKIDVLLFLLQM